MSGPWKVVPNRNNASSPSDGGVSRESQRSRRDGRGSQSPTTPPTYGNRLNPQGNPVTPPSPGNRLNSVTPPSPGSRINLSANPSTLPAPANRVNYMTSKARRGVGYPKGVVIPGPASLRSTIDNPWMGRGKVSNSTMETEPIVSGGGVVPMSTKFASRSAIPIEDEELEYCWREFLHYRLLVVRGEILRLRRSLSTNGIECLYLDTGNWGETFSMDSGGQFEQNMNIGLRTDGVEFQIELNYSRKIEGEALVKYHSSKITAFYKSGEESLTTSIPWFHGNLDQRRIHYLQLIEEMDGIFSSVSVFEAAKKCLRQIVDTDLKLAL
jgi:hypothetical protein